MGIELRRFVSHNLLQDQRRGPRRDREPVRFHAVVKMIRGNNAAGAGHVFDDPRRIAGDMLADMARDQPGVLIVGPARRITDDESQSLISQKILRPGARGATQNKRSRGDVYNPSMASFVHEVLLKIMRKPF